MTVDVLLESLALEEGLWACAGPYFVEDLHGVGAACFREITRLVKGDLAWEFTGLPASSHGEVPSFDARASSFVWRTT